MSSIVTWKWRAGLLAAALALLPSANIAFAQPFEMKLAYFVGDQHAMSQWLIKWSDKLAADSGGRITVKRARFQTLEVDALTVRKLRVLEREGPPPAGG